MREALSASDSLYAILATWTLRACATGYRTGGWPKPASAQKPARRHHLPGVGRMRDSASPSRKTRDDHRRYRIPMRDCLIAVRGVPIAACNMLKIMRRRLLTLLLAFVIAGTPVTFAVCELSCAQPPVARVADGLHHGHAHHHSPVAGIVTSIGTDSHECDHVDQSPAISPSQLKLPPATVARVRETISPLLEAERSYTAAIGQSPPGPVLRSVPLRI